MNTNEVAKLLSVSTSTVKRWVKQFDLDLTRNERGHYIFHEEDVELLKKLQSQSNQEHQGGSIEKQPRKGTVKHFVVKDASFCENGGNQDSSGLANHGKKQESEFDAPKKVASVHGQSYEKMRLKLELLENRLEEKADSVTSYQLLQHRGEIEELRNQVEQLTEKITKLEGELVRMKNKVTEDLPLVFDQPRPFKKPKKRNIISNFFGF